MSGALKLTLGATAAAGLIPLIGILIAFLSIRVGRRRAQGRLVGTAAGSKRRFADKETGKLELKEEFFPCKAIVEFDGPEGPVQVESRYTYDQEDFQKNFKVGTAVPVSFSRRDPAHIYSLGGEFARTAFRLIFACAAIVVLAMTAELMIFAYSGRISG